MQKNADPEAWIYFYQSRAKEEFGAPVFVFCGYFEVPAAMKEKLKHLKDEIYDRFPHEKLLKRFPHFNKLFETPFRTDMLWDAKESLEDDNIGYIAISYLKLRADEKRFLKMSPVYAVNVFNPISLPLTLHIPSEFKSIRRAKRAVKKRLIEVLGENLFAFIQKLNPNKKGYEKLASFFEELRLFDEANTVKHVVRQLVKKRKRDDSMTNVLLEPDM